MVRPCYGYLFMDVNLNKMETSGKYFLVLLCSLIKMCQVAPLPTNVRNVGKMQGTFRDNI